MLELWVDALPEDSADIDATTCQDFLRLIENQSVVLCTEKTNTEWNNFVSEWQAIFDKTLGIGKFEACRTYWLMPRSKEKNPEITTLKPSYQKLQTNSFASHWNGNKSLL